MRKKIAILNCDTSDDEFLDCNLANYIHGVIFNSKFCQDNISIVTYKTHKGELPEEEFDAIIITGSSQHISEDMKILPFWVNDLLTYIRQVTVPVLGVSFGMDLITYAYNGNLQHIGNLEDGHVYQLGFAPIVLSEEGKNHPLFTQLPDIFYSAMMRCVVTTEAPFGSIILAEDDYGVSAYQYKNYMAIQFHPEMNLNCIKRSLHIRHAKNQDGPYKHQFETALEQVDTEYRSSHDNENQIIYENFLKI